MAWFGRLLAPLRLCFVSSNSENISSVAFLKHKNSKNRELALWHLISGLVLENA
jgi:hypothetical protein